MRIKKMVLGLAAIAAVGVAVLSACSTAPTNSAAAAPAVAPAAARVAHAATGATVPGSSTSDTPAAAAAPAPAQAAPAQSTPAQAAAPAVAPVAAPPAAQPAAAVAPGVPCSVTARACVSISQHKVWLLQAGKITFGPVSAMPGSPKFPTPTGTFHVLSKNAHYRSHEFHGAAMPESVFFYPGDAFHVGSLSVFSHGCVHLSWSSGTTFFNTLHIGDEVQVVA